MIKEKCSLIGYISKPHGKGGQVVIRLNGDFADEIEPGEPLFLEINETMVPFFIEEIEGFTEKAVIKLEFIESLEEVKQYLGCNVYLKTTQNLKQLSISGSLTSDLIGYRVTDDTSGLTGIITGVANTTDNPLFELKNEDKIFFIPIQPSLMESIDKKNKCIRMKLPEGFADI